MNMDQSFSVENFLRSLRATKPPYECPKCKKIYKSYSGMEYHLVNFDHTAKQTPMQKPSHFVKKSKFSKKKKSVRSSRRSPSPMYFKTITRDTLTWAEAQRMVEIESEGKIYRLSIHEKLDIISDSDVDESDSSSSSEGTSDKDERNNQPKNSNKKQIDSDERKSAASTNGKDSVEIRSVPKETPSTTQATSHANKNKPRGSSSAVFSTSKLPKPSFRVVSNYDDERKDAPSKSSAYYRYIEKTVEELEEEVEYDMDEEDAVWLELMNKHRVKDGMPEVTHNQLELMMDRFEKESYFEQAKNGPGAQGTQPLIDEDAVCCVCNDGECQNSNVILFCDMCNLAVHQECYGVPYIPEGQWLCRRCLQSPSSPVDCCLCPNRSGAFKQTDDGRWSHVVCALWVPEVGFGNTVFLEPIDGLKRIPPARWRLTCYVCKQRNVGACIQCHRTNCYTAFHVTCAQQAGLYMKMEPVRESDRNGVTVTVKKEAYCDAHTPPVDSPRQKLNGQLVFDAQEQKTSDKMKKTRKILAEKRHELPHIAIPYIPRDKMSSIGRQLNIQRKSAFMQRLLSYWTLKRQSRNGVPLLRRLQSHVHANKPRNADSDSAQHHVIEQLKYWQRLRHDLERARLLIELIGKREKLKRECVRVRQVLSEFRLQPFLNLLRRTLNKLRAIDVAKIFDEPVEAQEAPDYYKIIKQPMDFSTMATKIENHKYKTLSDFEEDLNLIIRNCTYYNEKDTIYYRFAIKMRDQGGAVLRAAKREIERSGFDFESGMLLVKTPEKKSVEVIEDEARLKLPLQDQLDIMLERLDQAVLSSRKTKKIRAEISILKRRIGQESHNALRLAEKNAASEADGKQVTTIRRFSADDAEAPSNATESEAVVVSDVGSGFKLSPEVRSLSSQRDRAARKRLWSARSSLSPVSEPQSKKSHLERSESCPATSDTDETTSLLKRTQSRQSSDTLNGKGAKSSDRTSKSADELTDDDTSKSAFSFQTSCQPTSRTSVSRRTAVLFKKKPRERPHNLSIPEVNKVPETNDSETTKPPNPTNATIQRHNKRTRSASGHGLFDPYEDLFSSSPFKVATTPKETLLNGISPTEEENVFKETSGPTSNESHYREDVRCAQSASDSDSPLSSASLNGSLCNERKGQGKRKGSDSSTAGFPNNFHSDMGESGTSDDERPGLILGDNAELKEHYRNQSYASATEDEVEEDNLPHIKPLDLVWAKCRGYPPYPALLIDPKMPPGIYHNGVPIPVPPSDVLHVGDKLVENGNHRIFLVLFFDTKRTWQWLPRNKLEPLGDELIDQAKLTEVRRPGVRRNVEAAYKRARLHHSRVASEISDGDGDTGADHQHTDPDSRDA